MAGRDHKGNLHNNSEVSVILVFFVVQSLEVAHAENT